MQKMAYDEQNQLEQQQFQFKQQQRIGSSSVQQSQSCSQPDQQEFQEIQIDNDKQNIFQSSVSSILLSINSAYNTSKRTINQLATNIAYNAKHSSCPFINRKQIIIKNNSQPAYLMGKKYDYQQRQQFQNQFHNTIWICYRSKLQDKNGDVGWGCMIRVCQMVLAQALKRSTKNMMHNSEIIKEFSTSNQALFSFDKICMEGKIMKRWTSSVQIMIALQDLLKQQDKFQLYIEMYNTQVALQDIIQQKDEQKQYPLLMIVNNRLGINKVQQKMRDHLYAVLSHKYSIGMISGIGGQALYIAGYHQDQLIALDPHYVQPETEGQKLYYNQAPRGVLLSKIVPAAGFCFYFQSSNEHREWMQDVAQSWYFHQPNVVIQCQATYAKNIYEKRHPKSNKKQAVESDEQQQFQVLQ